MLSKRKKMLNYPIHAFNAELVLLMSGPFKAGGCAHASKPSARRHRANQALDRATFDCNRVDTQARKLHAARVSRATTICAT
jgi:hypothetical protein